MNHFKLFMRLGICTLLSVKGPAFAVMFEDQEVADNSLAAKYLPDFLSDDNVSAFDRDVPAYYGEKARDIQKEIAEKFPGGNPLQALHQVSRESSPEDKAPDNYRGLVEQSTLYRGLTSKQEWYKGLQDATSHFKTISIEMAQAVEEDAKKVKQNNWPHPNIKLPPLEDLKNLDKLALPTSGVLSFMWCYQSSNSEQMGDLASFLQQQVSRYSFSDSSTYDLQENNKFLTKFLDTPTMKSKFSPEEKDTALKTFYTEELMRTFSPEKMKTAVFTVEKVLFPFVKMLHAIQKEALSETAEATQSS